MEWIKAKVTQNDWYLSNEELEDKNEMIIITYVTKRNRKYVKAMQCNHGRLMKKFNGTPTAFMFMPEPYKEIT